MAKKRRSWWQQITEDLLGGKGFDPAGVSPHVGSDLPHALGPQGPGVEQAIPAIINSALFGQPHPDLAQHAAFGKQLFGGDKKKDPAPPAPAPEGLSDADKLRMFAQSAGETIAASMAPFITNIEHEADQLGKTEAPFLAKLGQPYRSILGAEVPMEQQMAHQLAAAFAEQTQGMPQFALASLIPHLAQAQRTGTPLFSAPSTPLPGATPTSTDPLKAFYSGYQGG